MSLSLAHLNIVNNAWSLLTTCLQPLYVSEVSELPNVRWLVRSHHARNSLMRSSSATALCAASLIFLIEVAAAAVLIPNVSLWAETVELDGGSTR
jgi:hypothetical protein